MPWQVSWSESTGADAAPAREPYDCPTATFDGSLRDPRTLVYLYQQRMRAVLLADVAEDAARPSIAGWALNACQDALEACEDGLRWLWLAEPRRPAPERPVVAPRLTAVPAPRLAPVPLRDSGARPALRVA